MSMKVRDVMTKDPFTIDPEAPLETAIDVMRTKKLRHLPMVDETGQLIGIITDRDLRRAAFGPAVAEPLSARAQGRLRGVGQTLENRLQKRVLFFLTVGVLMGLNALLDPSGPPWEKRLAVQVEDHPIEYADFDLVNLKVEGKEVTMVAPEVHRAQVIDLMDALFSTFS